MHGIDVYYTLDDRAKQKQNYGTNSDIANY